MYFDFAGKDARACVREMAHGYALSSALFAAVKLGVADALESGPKSVETLARECGADAESLRRVLRLLVGAGVFAEDGDGACRLSPRAEYLRRSHPESIAAEVLLFSGEEAYLAWSRLLHSARTSKPAFEDAFGVPLFEYLGGHREASERFHAGWREISARVGAEAAERYDFSRCSRLLDVGGGSGVVAASILRRHPVLRAAVYDLAFSFADAKAVLERFGVGDRCDILAGNALTGVPAGFDVHVLKSVLHNYPDAEAERILRNCARALPKGGRVLTIERVLGGDPWSRMVDAAMLVMTGGRERTLAQYEGLYARAGLRLAGCLALPSGFSVLAGGAASAGLRGADHPAGALLNPARA